MVNSRAARGWGTGDTVGTRLHGNQPWDADRGSGVKLCWNFCRIHRTEIWGAALEPTACSDVHILPGLTLARRPGLCSGDKGKRTARLPDQVQRRGCRVPGTPQTISSLHPTLLQCCAQCWGCSNTGSVSHKPGGAHPALSVTPK